MIPPESMNVKYNVADFYTGPTFHTKPQTKEAANLFDFLNSEEMPDFRAFSMDKPPLPTNTMMAPIKLDVTSDFNLLN